MGNFVCCKGNDEPKDAVVKIWKSLKLCTFNFKEFEEKSFSIAEKLYDQKVYYINLLNLG